MDRGSSIGATRFRRSAKIRQARQHIKLGQFPHGGRMEIYDQG